MFPHVEVIAHAIGPDQAASLRAGITGYRRYALVDRGSYEWAPLAEPVLRQVCELGAHRLGRALAPLDGRALRLSAGDYLLARHDQPVSGDARVVELVLDLSPVPVRAELQYRRLGNVFFRVPCSPRSLAVVERTPVVTCNHTYVSKLLLGVEVVRLIVRAGYTAPA